MALIVTSLMTVFSATQNAFRASLTQSDVLESGRIVMGLIKNDLDSMTPSLDVTNGAVNFYANTNALQYQSGRNPLVQPLAGGSTNRVNVLEKFFILTRQGTMWTGTGYVVDTSATATNFNSLYRFSMSANVMTPNMPALLFANFGFSTTLPISSANTNLSHLMDGVVSLTVRASDLNGYSMTNGYPVGYTNKARNVWFSRPLGGVVGCIMYSNTLPASVQVELGVLEDRALQRADSISVSNVLANYLAQQAGKVHLFRQNFVIRNVDPSAYQ